jgi:membrane protein implicated in regulation of membrane protease activity
VAIVWTGIAVLLIALELHHLQFFFVFAAGGAAGAAVVALIAPHHFAIQVGVACAVSVLGIALVRPYLRRVYARRGPGLRVDGVHGGLVDTRGVTLDEVRTDHLGHVRILGEKWLAVPWNDETIQPATPVIVTAVSRTTLTVRAADQATESS